MYYSIEQVAAQLHKTKRQIQYLIQQGLANPMNKDTYRRDGGYRFTEEEVERIIDHFSMEGLTVKEAARYLGITPQYIMHFVKKGELSSLVTYKGKQKRRYFTKEEIDRFKNILNDTREVNQEGIYGRKVQLISREAHIFEETSVNGSMARVISISPLQVLTEEGEFIAVEHIPSLIKPYDKKVIRKRGFVEFQFPIPRHYKHPVYQVLFQIIQQLGERNIQIYEQAYGDYYVRCRLGSVQLTEEEYRILQRHIVKGEMEYRNGNIYFHSGEVQKTVYVPKMLYEQVMIWADKKENTFDEIMCKALERYINEEK
ncbi:helix-turn-helix domain-containing protein [Pontibacillus litoralis]|uniref:Uncharacterized protein n=1 Tax=Pontibacillus litoralis JSM 072002 TaxID=1385512 RepID=A0A0A5G0P8_9BACI|nr:helix-turn-helix domain-containing protein [Pontibacillus litoralis]KGX84640.1 hypothetical protein N784_12245 [Pontibacillus litoralis JSM 072002]